MNQIQICRQGYTNSTWQLNNIDKEARKLVLQDDSENNGGVTLSVDKDKNDNILLIIEGTSDELCVMYSIGQTRGIKSEILDNITWNPCITKVYNQSSWPNKYTISIRVPKLRKDNNHWVYCKSAQVLAAGDVDSPLFYKHGNRWNARKSMYI